MKSLLRKFLNLFKIKQDLHIMYEYELVSYYSSTTKIKSISIDKIKQYYKLRKFYQIYISTNYVFFDIDDLNKYNHFVKNFDSYNYATFQSSPGHHWIIIDKTFQNYSSFIESELFTDWSVYCDTKYQNMTNIRKQFFIRGNFSNLKNQPKLIHKKGKFSTNFQNFIIKLEKYFDTDALELSTLQHNDTEMLLLLKRIKKLQRITNI